MKCVAIVPERIVVTYANQLSSWPNTNVIILHEGDTGEYVHIKVVDNQTAELKLDIVSKQ